MLSETARQLADDHAFMATRLAKGASARWPSLEDDFLSDAYLALVVSAACYAPGRGAEFRSYVRPRLVGSLIDTMRRAGRRIARDAQIRAACHVDRAREDRDIDAALDLESRFCCLPDQHRDVCRLIYRVGLNQADASRALGLSRSRVSAIHAESIAYLRARWAP